MSLDSLWFRPSLRCLSNVVSNADGRFQVGLPAHVVEAGFEIRAYCPGSASLWIADRDGFSPRPRRPISSSS